MATATSQAEPGISDKVLYEKVGFTPHSQGQKEYLFSKARFNVPCCGRRWGKSQAAGHRMTVKSFVPDSYNWIIGPTYKLGEKEFRVVWSDYQKLGLLKHCRKSYSVKQGNMRIQTPWDAIIEVVSAEKPDSLLGEGLSHAIMAEAAKHNMSTWEQYIEPALSDLLGTCDFPSTPQGYNWYHGLWQLGQLRTSDAESYKSWTFPSWANLVRYPGGLNNPEIQRLKRTASTAYFNQEYGAKFTAIVGSIYEEFNPDIHVQPHVFVPQWKNFHGYDYGFSNPFVCLDIQVDPQDNVYVWREYYERYRSTYEHGQAILARDNPQDYHVDTMWGDPRGADQAATLALLLGIVASEDVPWTLSVEQIKRMLKASPPKLYIDPSCTNLIRQMEQLHVKEQSANSKFDLSELTGDRNIQHKRDDHAADALRYFIGPYFVAGRDVHLEDIYGEFYTGSESEEFLTLHQNVILGEDFVPGAFN